MKKKTSITLSHELLAAVDRLAGDEPRSAFIERVLRTYVRKKARGEIHARDLAALNRSASALNAEAADVFAYQASWPEEEG